MDPFTMAERLLGHLALTSGQLAHLRALDTRYFTELAAMARGDTRAPRDRAALHAGIAADIRDILTEEQRVAFDRNLAQVLAAADAEP